ncbi:MAG: hypothetical protein HND48_18410 [Chloroflexi bacterium]|nr:hypothetical protein [Chloroflexota bacterium]
MADHMRLIPLPQMTDAERDVVMLSSWVWTVNAASEHTDIAWKFVDYASQQGARWLPTAGYILPRIGWTDDPSVADFPGLDVFIDQMQYGRPRLIHPRQGEIATIIHQYVQDAILNNLDAQETLDSACDEINAALAG